MADGLLSDDFLLQPSLRGDARMEALARLIARLSKLPVDTPIVNLIDLVDASALASLGEQFHVMGVEGWNAAATDAARRKLLKKAVELHRHKGTPWAVAHALETALALPAEISEWFDYGGEPYFFRVGLDVTGAYFGPETGRDAFRLIFAWKNVRSWLEYLKTESRTPLEERVGVGLRSRTLSRSFMYFAPPEPPVMCRRIGLGLGGVSGTRLRLYFPPCRPALSRRNPAGVTGITSTRVGAEYV